MAFAKLRTWCVLISISVLAGCTSIGSLGLITKSSVNPIAAVKKSDSPRQIGPAEGTACRYFVLAVIPFGNSDIQNAVDKALSGTDGNALVNVTTSTSLYGFFPIYNVFSFTCTTVKGTAVQF